MEWNDAREVHQRWAYSTGDKRLNEKRIHPTQKPVALYKWILQNYAKTGDLILDTHVGSASSLIACHDMGFDYIGFEIDAKMYSDANERLTEFQAQLRIETNKTGGRRHEEI